MARRDIAIIEDLYLKLEKRKMKDESSTKVIRRLLDENDKPSAYFGAWGELSKDEEEKIEKAKRELRNIWNGSSIIF